MYNPSQHGNHPGVHSKTKQGSLSATLEARRCSIHRTPTEPRTEGMSSCWPCTEMSEKKEKILRNVLGEPNPEIEVIEKGISRQCERRVEIPKTSTGTRRVSVLFRGIGKQLRNQLLNGFTRREGQRSLLATDRIHHLSESPSYIEESDLPGKIYHAKEGGTTKDPAILFQDKVLDMYKRRYQEKLYPIGDPGGGWISGTGDDRLQDILGHIDRGIYQRSALYLDVSTAGNNVVVKGDLKSAFWSVEDQCYPKTRKRFKDPQVLSANSFRSGQNFWVVETSRSGNWRIGMCYPSIARKGFHSYIGCSDKSWGLCKWNNEYSVMHNCKEIPLSPGLSSQKLAIFLDYKAGQLSFYELSDPVRLLHTFTTTFTEPLHAVFRIWLDSLGSSWILIKD